MTGGTASTTLTVQAVPTPTPTPTPHHTDAYADTYTDADADAYTDAYADTDTDSNAFRSGDHDELPARGEGAQSYSAPLAASGGTQPYKYGRLSAGLFPRVCH